MSEEVKGSKLEEIRAFFVLGLLAVLASIRTQSIAAPIGSTTLPLNPIIDTMILLMSLYALLMVFGYSKDLIGETIASFFRSLAIQFLILTFIIVFVFAILYAFAFYQTRLLWLTLLIAIPSGYVGYRKFQEFRRKRSPNAKRKLTFKDKVRIAGQTLGGFGIAICAIMISYYSPEQLVWIFFVIGSIAMIEWLYFVSKGPQRFNEDSDAQEKM